MAEKTNTRDEFSRISKSETIITEIIVYSYIFLCVADTTDSPYNPQTPGSSVDTGHSSGAFGTEWHTTDIEIKVRNSNENADLAGQHGYITAVNVSWKKFIYYYWKIYGVTSELSQLLVI